MRTRILFLIVCVLTCSVSFANDIERVSTTYEYRSDNPNETPEQAERKAIDKAKLKALEDKFGVDVSSINSTFVRSRSSGSNAQSETNVFSIGSTSIRGEWIETVKEQVLVKEYQQGFWFVKVHVEGKARSKTEAQIEIKTALINNDHDRYSRDVFMDGDDIFLRFSSPVSGYLCVYLIDENEDAFCLLPYQSNSTGHQSVNANEDYLFFSRQTDRDADEYTLNTQREQESNAVYIVFSPNSLTKANDEAGAQNWRDEPLPRTLTYGAFLKWLSRNQMKDRQMVVKREIITIRK